MSQVFVNGRTIHVPAGKSVSVINNQVFVDGVLFTDQDNPVNIVNVVIEGNVGELKADGGVEVKGNVEGSIKCEGSVNCGDVKGDVKAGGSVNCGNVGGNLKAGGSVNCNKRGF